MGLSAVAPPVYTPLKLGEIQPYGWLRDQLRLQADGLGGHMQEFYPLIKEGGWTGEGNVNYSDLNETGSYWFWEDGWMGPETDEEWQPRWLWGRYPFLLGAIGMAEAEPELSNKIVSALMRFVQLANEMLREGKGTQDWTRGTRWQDFVLALQWLHDWHIDQGRGSPEVLNCCTIPW
ncbi:hypothetical protein FRC12_013286 [Ceratobasidium sp. 428]|nr:hypothetical protein FRC12_013286 [Ceratobasidium sp. 428]